MSQARQVYEGNLPVARMLRRIAFDRGLDGRTMVHVQADAQLALVCQRSLEIFTLPIAIDQDFGVIATESDEAALLPDVEPWLSPDGVINLAELIEDELILALPLIPAKPGAKISPVGANGTEFTQPPESQPNPFEVLRELKRNPEDA